MSARGSTYYNEIDPNAAAWLRELIRCGLIPAGDVDERDIRDVQPDDLAGYRQHHFFAGIGGWAYALRLAGWPDSEPVWTGSCPCPPFSAAGKGSECPSCGGGSCLAHPVVTAGWLCLDCGDEWRGDDRHLLPEFIRLIGEFGPSSVFGEQVASRDGRLWFHALRAVLERVGYALGCADLCAAGYGAPHIRQRLFFGAERLADADDAGPQGRVLPAERARERLAGPGGVASGLDDTASARHVGAQRDAEVDPRHETRLRMPDTGRADGRLAQPHGRERQRVTDGEGRHGDRAQTGRLEGDRFARTSGRR